MAKQPLFTAMAALTLALGIGANAAIFSFLDAILLRALPVPHPASLVVLNWHAADPPSFVQSMGSNTFRDAKLGFSSSSFPYAAYEIFRQQKGVFSSVFAFFPAGSLNVIAHGQAEIAAGQYCSGEYFSGLGVTPAAGRWIEPADDLAGAAPAAVLSFRYARRRFGEPSGALGKPIQVNSHDFTVVGVAGPEFFGVDPAGAPDIFVPLHASLLPQLTSRFYVESNLYWLRLMGRLREGVTREQALAALAPAFQNLVASSAAGAHFNLPALYLQDGAGGLDVLRRRYSRPLYVLMTMVALILAIACANVANLLLARATGRRREMALRLSLGASRWRIVRQLLTESVSLALVGGVLGAGFAACGIRALTFLLGNGRPDFTLHAELDGRVLAILLALSVAAGIIFGLVPAIQSMRADLDSTLRQPRTGVPHLRFASWLRVAPSHLLVISQIAMSLVLLAGAALFIRTLQNLGGVSLGFRPERIMLFTVNARQAGYRDGSLVRFYEELHSRLSAVPGVRSVTASDQALVAGYFSSTSVILPEFRGKDSQAHFLKVAPAFFSTMQIPILLGREIDERDIRQGAAVAVVNEVFAKTFFPGRNPIGARFGMGLRGAPPQVEIVGVSRDALYESLKYAIPPVVYIPYSQSLALLGPMTYELRAAGGPLALARPARQALREIDAGVPASGIRTQTDQIDQTTTQERTFAALCTCFALLALAIACVGLYGTMAYNVARRTNEIGLRIALGARHGSVVWMVLREVLLLAGAGLAMGLGAALFMAHLLDAFVFQMKPNDPLVLSCAAISLLAAALFAGFGPALRAARVDPWTALRNE